MSKAKILQIFIVIFITPSTLQVNITGDRELKRGHYLNSAKSFTMVFSNSSKLISLHASTYTEQLLSLVCSGSIITSDARCEKEIRRQLGIGKSTFTSMKKVLSSSDIHKTVLLNTLCEVKYLRIFLFLYRQYINKNIFLLTFFKNSH